MKPLRILDAVLSDQSHLRLPTWNEQQAKVTLAQITATADIMKKRLRAGRKRLWV
jgi:hypothetical protein